jgi:hypothetical protein
LPPKKEVTVKHLGRTSGQIAVAIAAVVGVAMSYGQTPAPAFQALGVTATVTSNGTQYLYSYCLSNPSSNGLGVWDIELDVSPLTQANKPSIAGPSGWVFDVGTDAFASWGTTESAQSLGPGSQLCGFGLNAAAPPSIRKLAIQPWLNDYLRNLRQQREAEGKDLDEDEEDTIRENYTFRTHTLGPLAATPGSFAHWDAWQADISQAKQLGWISDAALATTIETNVSAARQALLANDTATARAKLQAVIDSIQGSQPSQRTSEGYTLVFLNGQYLRDHLPTPCEPKLSLTPESATQSLGGSYTATATLLNVANGTPFPGFYVTVRVLSGPNAGTVVGDGVDENGMLKLTYIGARLGEDQIQARTPQGPSAPASAGITASTCIPLALASNVVTVDWEGGADLAVTSFFPPMVKTSGGQTSFVTEETGNLGDATAPPSVTRYYLSPTKAIDAAAARVVGERQVPELAPEASSKVDQLEFTVPSDLPEGLYYLGACADADGAVAETNELNNCSFSIGTRYLIHCIVRLPPCPVAKAPDGMSRPVFRIAARTVPGPA